jgi:hypothetical protein
MKKRFPFWSWFWVILGILYFFMPLIATLDFSLRAKKGVLSLLAFQRVLADPNFLQSFMFSIEMGIATIIVSTAGIWRQVSGDFDFVLGELPTALAAEGFGVVTQINLGVLSADDFSQKENGAFYLKDDARKGFLAAWQKLKQEQLTHPFLKEKIPWGMVPCAQAMLLARHLRGDLDAYPPFFWK